MRAAGLLRSFQYRRPPAGAPPSPPASRARPPPRHRPAPQHPSQTVIHRVRSLTTRGRGRPALVGHLRRDRAALTGPRGPISGSYVTWGLGVWSVHCRSRDRRRPGQHRWNRRRCPPVARVTVTGAFAGARPVARRCPDVGGEARVIERSVVESGAEAGGALSRRCGWCWARVRRGRLRGREGAVGRWGGGAGMSNTIGLLIRRSVPVRRRSCGAAAASPASRAARLGAGCSPEQRDPVRVRCFWLLLRWRRTPLRVVFERCRVGVGPRG